jgi:hypothetical protein
MWNALENQLQGKDNDYRNVVVTPLVAVTTYVEGEALSEALKATMPEPSAMLPAQVRLFKWFACGGWGVETHALCSFETCLILRPAGRAMCWMGCRVAAHCAWWWAPWM